jgi:hypothetical protein
MSAAVVAAFAVQVLQARSDRALARERRRELYENTLIAAQQAGNALVDLEDRLETKLLKLQPSDEIREISWRLGLVDHYLTRDRPSVGLASAFVAFPSSACGYAA